jgi:hypothetical protein
MAITLTIDGQPRTLIELREFRKTHDLPEHFAITQFEDKDYTGLARMDTGAPRLNELREGILAAVPEELRQPDLMYIAETMSAMLRAGLYAINDEIGLKPAEIDFAVSGFSDMLQAWTYTLIRARPNNDEVDPGNVYREWLDNSVRLSQPGTVYRHHDEGWRIQTINTAYGRVGMVIRTDSSAYYVQDTVLACPADGYMYRLFCEVATRVAEGIS